MKFIAGGVLMKEKIHLMLGGITMIFLSAILVFTGMNKRINVVNKELVIEQNYILGVIAYDPYTLKRLLLLLGMISFCIGIRLLIIVRNYKRKR